MRLRIVCVAVSLGLAGCASPPSSTVAPTETAIPIVLRAAPPDLGCDAVGVPYEQVRFRIDATAEEQVLAVADTGAVLRTFWSLGFLAGSSAEPAVRDPAGQLVVADGDVLVIPDRAWPRLHGHFVCPSIDALYVFLRDPS